MGVIKLSLAPNVLRVMGLAGAMVIVFGQMDNVWRQLQAFLVEIIRLSIAAIVPMVMGLLGVMETVSGQMANVWM